MAPEAVARGLTALLVACVCAMGCDRSATPATVRASVDPSPAVVHATTVVRASILDERQRPVRGARLTVDAHMSHPGMAPVTAAMVERDGTYEARVQLTMAGMWTVVVTGEVPGGIRVTSHSSVMAIERADSRDGKPGT